MPGSDWAKRAPLLLLFLLTYFVTVSRYFSKTTAKVESLAPGDAPARPRSRASAGRS
jgi:hypothetical protein